MFHVDEKRKRKDRFSLCLLLSFIFHVIVALAISRIYAEPPQSQRRLTLVSSVRIQFKNIEQKVQNKLVHRSQSEQVSVAKRSIKEKQPVVTKSVRPTEVVKELQPWEAALLSANRSAGGGGQGSSGSKGTLGAPGDRPGMSASRGIDSPLISSKTGGSGLSADRIHGSFALPTGSSNLPGGGGNEDIGFQAGFSKTGRGIGKIDVPGRGGAGGTGGRANEGPGRGLARGSGTSGSGAGKGSAGIGIGDGAGKMGLGGTGEGPGAGSGRGSGTGTGPGTSAYSIRSSKPEPNTQIQVQDKETVQEAPGKTEVMDKSRPSAMAREGFKAELSRSISNLQPEAPKTPEPKGYQSALQDEINRDLHSLRKMYEDWQNLKLPEIPKSLQITVTIDSDNGSAKILSIDLHSNSLPQRIKDDLTRKIKGWKFRSLFDGKDDPKSWPVILTGRISWQ